MPHRPAAFACLTFLAACQAAQPVAAPDGPAGAAPVAPSNEPQPPNLVAALCADCHAIGSDGLSPEAKAPAFSTLARQPGLNEAGLTRWLLDAHNYPVAMEFELSEPEARAVARYLIELEEAEQP